MPRRDDAELHALLLDLIRSVGLLHAVPADGTGPTSLSEIFALHELAARDGQAQQQLAASLNLDKSTVSRLVAGLEARGLLVRDRDPDNRRIVRLAITPAGRRLHQELGRAMHAHQRAVFAAMTVPERAALRTGLTALLRALHHPAAR